MLFTDLYLRASKQRFGRALKSAAASKVVETISVATVSARLRRPCWPQCLGSALTSAVRPGGRGFPRRRPTRAMRKRGTRGKGEHAQKKKRVRLANHIMEKRAQSIQDVHNNLFMSLCAVNWEIDWSKQIMRFITMNKDEVAKVVEEAPCSPPA